MKNISIFTIVLFSLLTTTSCSKDEDFFGSGDITSELRDVSSFQKVHSEGIIDITIIQGPVQSLEVIADDNIISRVKTTVSNNRLRIYLEDGIYDNVSIEANITMPELKDLENQGTGNIMIIGMNDQDELDINNSGTGDITISGNTNILDLKNEGTGSFNGIHFMTANSDIEISGTGDCTVYCTDTLDVKIEGSGSVFYIGEPFIKANISGSGAVIDIN